MASTLDTLGNSGQDSVGGVVSGTEETEKNTCEDGHQWKGRAPRSEQLEHPQGLAERTLLTGRKGDAEKEGRGHQGKETGDGGGSDVPTHHGTGEPARQTSTNQGRNGWAQCRQDQQRHNGHDPPDQETGGPGNRLKGFGGKTT